MRNLSLHQLPAIRTIERVRNSVSNVCGNITASEGSRYNLRRQPINGCVSQRQPIVRLPVLRLRARLVNSTLFAVYPRISIGANVCLVRGIQNDRGSEKFASRGHYFMQNMKFLKFGIAAFISVSVRSHR